MWSLPHVLRDSLTPCPLNSPPLPPDHLATYFGSLNTHINLTAKLPLTGLHIALDRARPQPTIAAFKSTSLVLQTAFNSLTFVYHLSPMSPSSCSPTCRGHATRPWSTQVYRAFFSIKSKMTSFIFPWQVQNIIEDIHRINSHPLPRKLVGRFWKYF